MSTFSLSFQKLTKRLTIQKPNPIFTFSDMFLKQNTTTHNLSHKNVISRLGYYVQHITETSLYLIFPP